VSSRLRAKRQARKRAGVQPVQPAGGYRGVAATGSHGGYTGVARMLHGGLHA
jgi:hypothetical protein